MIELLRAQSEQKRKRLPSRELAFESRKQGTLGKKTKDTGARQQAIAAAVAVARQE